MTDATHTDDSWGPWIEHDGLEVPEGIIGQVTHAIHHHEGVNRLTGCMSREQVSVATGNHAAWVFGFGRNTVIRYRIRKPRDMAVLDAVMADLTDPIVEGVE